MHDIDAALEFDRVLVIEEGGVREDGAPQELAADTSSRFAYLLDKEKAFLARLADDGWRKFRVGGGNVTDERPGSKRPEALS